MNNHTTTKNNGVTHELQTRYTDRPNLVAGSIGGVTIVFDEDDDGFILLEPRNHEEPEENISSKNVDYYDGWYFEDETENQDDQDLTQNEILLESFDDNLVTNSKKLSTLCTKCSRQLALGTSNSNTTCPSCCDNVEEFKYMHQ